MTLYSVYEHEAAIPELVADRFSWLAFLLPPVYALLHGLWLALLVMLLALAGLAAAGTWLGAGAAVGLYGAAALLFGFEAPTLRRLQLARKGWAYRLDVLAADPDLALRDYLERRA